MQLQKKVHSFITKLLFIISRFWSLIPPLIMDHLLPCQLSSFRLFLYSRNHTCTKLQSRTIHVQKTLQIVRFWNVLPVQCTVRTQFSRRPIFSLPSFRTTRYNYKILFLIIKNVLPRRWHVNIRKLIPVFNCFFKAWN